MGLLGAIQDPQFRKDVARGLLDAGNRGAVAGLLGGPVDLATMALRPLGYNVEQPVGGSEWIGQKMQNLGLVSEKRNPLAEGLAAFAGPMAAQQIAPKVFAAELRAMENMAKPSPMNAATRGQAGAIVWHGSPHKFDKFDSSKIGTGEGNQAYGHGLYLAEAPAVAKEYAGALSAAKASKPVGKVDLQDVYQHLSSDVPDSLLAARRDFRALNEMGALSASDRRDFLAAVSNNVSAAKGGSLYKVDLPDDQIARMLDWDKPLSQQAPEVQAALAKVGGDYTKLALKGGTTRGGQVYMTDLQNDFPDAIAATNALRNAGVPGIRYLDQGSRGAGTGTSNYVVFPGNENLLRILERNGQALP